MTEQQAQELIEKLDELLVAVSKAGLRQESLCLLAASVAIETDHATMQEFIDLTNNFTEREIIKEATAIHGAGFGAAINIIFNDPERIKDL